MMERIRSGLPGKGLKVVASSLLVFLLTATYTNHFQNSFHFDDAHTIVNNAAIRELKNIPLFLRDATTFSTLPSNQSYRPLVSTLLTIDYSLGGLQPFWFHLSIFVLFVTLVLLLAFVIDRLLVSAGASIARGWVALAAAACYGVHPANADTVNYVIASSEVISTLGVVLSFAFYFAFPRWRRSCLFILPAALAILAKPPAATFAPLFAVYRLLFPSDGNQGGKARTFLPAYLVEVAPAFLLCGGIGWFVQAMTPSTWVNGGSGMHNYLITQPYVVSLYFKTFFRPTALSADYDLNPFVTTSDPRFWIGCVFLVFLILLAFLTGWFRQTRLIGFGIFWFLITLLPTSLFPLAEVMNDHRTFLPYIGLVIAVAALGSLLVERVGDRRWIEAAGGIAVVLFLGANAFATFQRNEVWKNEETLWHDVTIKSPRNPRGLMNYGNCLMARGDFKGALDYFHQALTLAPRYPVLLVNLAIAKDATKQPGAEDDFREALRLAPGSPESYTYYARYLIAHARTGEGLPLVEKALALSPTDVAAKQLLAQSAQSPANHTPEYYLGLSLELYRAARYAESISAARDALALRPAYAEAWNNIGASYNQLGQIPGRRRRLRGSVALQTRLSPRQKQSRLLTRQTYNPRAVIHLFLASWSPN